MIGKFTSFFLLFFTWSFIHFGCSNKARNARLMTDKKEPGLFIAKGVTGIVYTQNDASVIAFKKLSPKFRWYGVKELGFLSRLENIPGIVEAQGVCFQKGTTYIQMKRYQQSLSQYIHTKGKDGLAPDVRDMFFQLVRTAFMMHERGVIHGDLKPCNILVNANPTQPYSPQTFIADFSHSFIGLSTAGDFLSHAAFSTPYFRSHEQCVDTKKLLQFSTSADVFSLGAIFYCLLTGKVSPKFHTIHHDTHNVSNDELLQFYSAVFSREALEQELGADMKPELDLLCGMLHPDPHKRLTMKQILEHEYLSSWKNQVPVVLKQSAASIAKLCTEDRKTMCLSTIDQKDPAVVEKNLQQIDDWLNRSVLMFFQGDPDTFGVKHLVTENCRRLQRLFLSMTPLHQQDLFFLTGACLFLSLLMYDIEDEVSRFLKLFTDPPSEPLFIYMAEKIVINLQGRIGRFVSSSIVEKKQVSTDMDGDTSTVSTHQQRTTVNIHTSVPTATSTNNSLIPRTIEK